MAIPYEVLVRFTAQGDVGGAHARTIDIRPDGSAVESGAIPLSGVDDPAFVEFASRFSAKAIVERDEALAQVVQIQSQLDAAKEDALKQASEMRRKIAELESQLPWDKRIIDAKAFLARVPSILLVWLFSSEDATTKQVSAMLTEYVAKDWPILLDSPEMQRAVAHLVLSGSISEEIAKDLTRDASQAEAYRAGD